jgi:disulfide bond formation protein DsbB
MTLIDRYFRRWPLLAAGVAAFMLAAAHGFETFGHFPPCELCLQQRDVYWLIVGLGVFSQAISRALTPRWRPALWRGAVILITLLFASECALAAYHAGVEWKWWAGPATCTGAGVHPVTAADMTALLSGQPQHVVQCDVAAWRLLGLSMAGWNAFSALVFTLLSAACALRKAPHV